MDNICCTKEELADKGLLNVAPYSVASDIIKALHRGTLDGIHIPHSDVYFVRVALEKHTGYWFPLDVVEAAMKAEGWRERRGYMRF